MVYSERRKRSASTMTHGGVTIQDKNRHQKPGGSNVNQPTDRQ